MQKLAKLQYRAASGVALIAGAGSVILAISGRPGFAVIWAVFALINTGIAFINREMMN